MTNRMKIHRIDIGLKDVRIIDSVDLLREVIETTGHDANVIQVIDLQSIADRLSLLVDKDPPWGWRYLRNVINRKMDAGKPLLDAMVRLRAVLDGTPEDVARAAQVAVQALGEVRSGALILADSKPCAGCGIDFVPRVSRQRFHSVDCRKGFYRSSHVNK